MTEKGRKAMPELPGNVLNNDKKFEKYRKN